jgi:transposase InsO family protein
VRAAALCRRPLPFPLVFIGGRFRSRTVVDWFSRQVLTWRLSITMVAAFCVEALEEALSRYGPPEILNTDPGSQSTSAEFTVGAPLAKGIAISMEGKGLWRDNVFVERRLWRTIKYEEVDLRAYDTVSDARCSLGSLVVNVGFALDLDHLNWFKAEPVGNHEEAADPFGLRNVSSLDYATRDHPLTSCAVRPLLVALHKNSVDPEQFTGPWIFQFRTKRNTSIVQRSQQMTHLAHARATGVQRHYRQLA